LPQFLLGRFGRAVLVNRDAVHYFGELDGRHFAFYVFFGALAAGLCSLNAFCVAAARR